MADAAMPLHIGHFGDDETGTRIGEHAQMGHVPVGCRAIIGAILAHGRNDDAVREFKISEPDRREQGAHAVGGDGVAGVITGKS